MAKFLGREVESYKAFEDRTDTFGNYYDAQSWLWVEEPLSR